MAVTNFIITLGERASARGGRTGPRGRAPAGEGSADAGARPPAHPLTLAPPPSVGVGAVAMLLSKDLKQSSAMLRRNLRHVRGWLEEQGAAAE